MRCEYKIDRKIVLGDFLRSKGISRRMGRKIKYHGKTMVNGKPARFNAVLCPGDILTVEYFEEINANIPPARFPLNIIYQDDWLMVISKPANLSVLPSKKHRADNLVGRIAYYYQKTGCDRNIHIVNRLDYATSGLLAVAKDGHTHHLLASRALARRYLAVVRGIPAPAGVINLPIGRAIGHSIKRAIIDSGAEAISEYRLVAARAGLAIVEVSLKTGRTHQIRLHMSAIGHPIIGDRLYGDGGERLLLHSYYLAFVHPHSNRLCAFVNYPNWYENVVENSQKMWYN